MEIAITILLGLWVILDGVCIALARIRIAQLEETVNKLNENQEEE